MGSHSSDGERGDTRAILDAIRSIVRALRESSRAAEKRLGLSGAQLFVLLKLSGTRALSLKELAERTLTHQSSVSVVASKLVDGGFVERAPSRIDRRRIELTLTRKGRALLGRAPEAAQDQLIAAIEALSGPRRRSLAKELRALASAMSVSARVPTMFFEEETPTRRAR